MTSSQVVVALDRSPASRAALLRAREVKPAPKRAVARFPERLDRERVGTTAGAPRFGVGLWLASEIVSAMGGTISVSSQSGEGATFTVRLPRGLGPAPSAPLGGRGEA